MQDTQMPPPSPPQVTIKPTQAVIFRDVANTSCQNINPLTEEDLSKILDQSTQQARLCTNPVLVSVDVIQKAVADPTRVKVNPQEPPSISKATSTKILLLPPPPPPNTISDNVQMLSAEIRKIIGLT